MKSKIDGRSALRCDRCGGLGFVRLRQCRGRHDGCGKRQVRLQAAAVITVITWKIRFTWGDGSIHFTCDERCRQWSAS